MQRGIHVGAANRLDESADHVVVLVAVAVVAQQSPVDGHRDDVSGHDRLLVDLGHGRRRQRRRFQRRECAPGVTGSETDDEGPRLLLQHNLVGETAWIHYRPVDENSEVVVIQHLEGQQERTGQERRDHREGGVLGGGRHENDPAVLDTGQQRILLRLAEPMDLVEKQHRGDAIEIPRRHCLFHHLAHVFDPCVDGREFDELAAGRARDGLGKGGLPRARRSPEDDRGRSLLARLV